MPDQIVLRPADIPVALRLAEMPGATFEELHDALGISTSTAYEAVERLQLAGLMLPDRREPNRLALLEFLEHGVRYAFPATLHAPTRGVPTAHTGPMLSSAFQASDAIVWPDSHGKAVGPGLTPLFPQAANLPARCPSIYGLLTLVDAIRVGRARERQLAVEQLRRALRRPAVTNA